MNAQRFFQSRWTVFVSGMAVGMIAIAAVRGLFVMTGPFGTPGPLVMPEAGLDEENSEAQVFDNQKDDPGETWHGTVALLLRIRGQEARCETGIEGNLRPKPGFSLLDARFEAASLDCGAAESSAFVKNNVFRSDNYPMISLVILVGHVDREKVILVDQLILLGERLMLEGVQAEYDEEGVLQIALEFERSLLGLWTPTVDDVEVGHNIRLEATLRKVVEEPVDV